MAGVNLDHQHRCDSAAEQEYRPIRHAAIEYHAGRRAGDWDVPESDQEPDECSLDAADASGSGTTMAIPIEMLSKGAC